MDIIGRWALITGSSRGIGRLIAKDLASKGCKIILHSRRLTGTKELLEEILSMGNECHSVAAELSDIGEVTKLVDDVKKITDDHLDILYNNAAIMTTYQPIFKPTIILIVFNFIFAFGRSVKIRS